MTASNTTPVTLWIFHLELLNVAKDRQTANVNALSFVSKLGMKLPPTLTAGDVINVPEKGWKRVLELLTYSDPDAPQRVLCTAQTDPSIPGVQEDIVLPPDALHCITRVPPAQVAYDDVLVMGSSGTRYYARVDGIEYHNGKWLTKQRPSK